MAIVITFNLGDLPEKALNKISSQNGMTPDEYAKNIVMTFLNDQVRGYYLEKFNALTTQQIVSIFGDLI